MTNLMSYIRGWLDGKGIEHDDMDMESDNIEIYNTKVKVDGVYSISWGRFPKTNCPVTFGWPDMLEGVYMLELEYGGEPTAISVEDYKALVESYYERV